MDVVNWRRRRRGIFYLFFYLKEEGKGFVDRTVAKNARIPWLHFFWPVTNQTD
jgi:hypothetical protein